MKMVQMDSLNFSDNFSYINYLIWSYGWISMIFRSFSYFLEFPELFLNPENTYCVSMTLAWRQQVNWAVLGQTWPVGPTGQCNSAGLGH